MLRMPAARSVCISSATVSAVCLRPVRRISFSTNDCTPRLTRLMPHATQARACSLVMVPGAASMVASTQGRPGIASSTARKSSGAILLGVPPPRYTVSGRHSHA